MGNGNGFSGNEREHPRWDAGDGGLMKRGRSCKKRAFCLGIAAWLSTGLVMGGTAQTAPAIRGEFVAGDVPVTYRLPAVADSLATSTHDQTASQRLAPDFDQQLVTVDELVAELDQATRIAALPSPAERQVQEHFTQPSPTFDDHGAVWHEPDPPSTFPYTPAADNLSLRLLPSVQHGYALAQRGAMAAARAEFILVLRRIAQSKDATCGTDQHSVALAEGLRALDEARDFVPPGIQLEANLNVPVVASAHRTPVVRDRSDEVLPHEAVALYHTYAEDCLARAVGGEQAGSMVLHGLGKAYARESDRDDDLHAMRSAMTMYMAALVACPTNHLAANELGVLLCQNGHAAEAAQLFEQTINLAPTATNYHNLAVAQEKLGLDGQAAANERESQRLAALERAHGELSRRAGIEWVAPAEMSGLAPVAPGLPTASNSLNPAPQTPPIVGARDLPRSPWQRTKDFAKSLPFPGRSADETSLAPTHEFHVARPAPIEGAARWR